MSYANATAVRAGGRKRGSWKPWEDVFLGFGLSAMAAASRRMLVVDIGWSLFYEQWGFKVRRNTLVWHAKGIKDADRVRALHRWAAEHHCRAAHASSHSASCFSKRVSPRRFRSVKRLRRRGGCREAEAQRPFETDGSSFGWFMCVLPRNTSCSDEEVRLAKPSRRVGRGAAASR